MKMAVDKLINGPAFLNELQEGIWIADDRGRITFANRSLARLLGYNNPDQLVGKVWRELFPPAEASRLSRTRPEADVRMLTDSCILGRDKHPIPVSVVLMRRTVEDATWLIGSVMECPAGRQPGLGEWTSRQVMENAIDGICIIENGQIVYVNRRFEELTGYSSPQLGRMSLERLLIPKDRKAIAQMLSDPHRLPLPIHHEVRVMNRSGHEIECELRLVPAETDSRTLLIAYLRDISQVKQAERIRGDFIAMVSHDLRTPLAAIKEAISLLAESAAGRLEERQRRYLAIAREEMDRLNRMIDNLIEVSRMEAGKVALDLAAVDLKGVLATALDSLALLIQKKNLKIERIIPDNLPPVLADRDRLLRVFNNLLDNAIKYSPEGGTIRIEIGPVDPAAPVLSENGILANTGYLQVTISDEGPGIPAEFLERIFGKFERVDPHGPGIGLGLAIVKSIIQMHHGKVWARSVLGEGASFSFVLPVKENS